MKTLSILFLALFVSACGTDQVNQEICFKASEYTGCNPSAHVYEGEEGDPLHVCKSSTDWKKEADKIDTVNEKIVKPFESRCNIAL